MKFTERNLYHIYNHGNNYQTIFFNRDNYKYFLEKVKKYITPSCDIISYCLVPNQFQLLIYSNPETVDYNINGRNNLSEGMKLLLSSYTKGINKQECRSGSLFTQNTRSKNISNEDNFADNCFNFIHQFPLRNNLVKKIEDWEFSSFSEYYNKKSDSLCNTDLAEKLLNIESENLYEFSTRPVPEEIVKKYFRNAEKSVAHF